MKDKMDGMFDEYELMFAEDGESYFMRCLECDEVPCGVWADNKQAMILFNKATHEEKGEHTSEPAPSRNVQTDGTHHQQWTIWRWCQDEIACVCFIWHTRTFLLTQTQLTGVIKMWSEEELLGMFVLRFMVDL
jgi:hypothetical protein